MYTNWSIWGSLKAYATGLLPLILQAFPPRSHFAVEDIPDLTGKVVIVTGGNTGIGKETVKALLEHNAKVYLAARDQKKAEAAIVDLEQATGRRALFLKLDLASLMSVKDAAKDFLANENELHVLFNNAGVMYPPRGLATSDGYDLQFGVNVLGHFYFTELLMSALIAGTGTSCDGHTRVVTTSSGGAHIGELFFDTFTDGPARQNVWIAEDLYHQSKLANVIVAREVAKRYAHEGVISISVNPGNISSDLQRHLPWLVRKLSKTFVLYPTPYGALTQLWAGTMPEALNYNGEFCIPWARPGKCRAEAYDAVIGERLWNWLKDEVDRLRG